MKIQVRSELLKLTVIIININIRHTRSSPLQNRDPVTYFKELKEDECLIEFIFRLGIKCKETAIISKESIGVTEEENRTANISTAFNPKRVSSIMREVTGRILDIDERMVLMSLPRGEIRARNRHLEFRKEGSETISVLGFLVCDDKGLDIISGEWTKTPRNQLSNTIRSQKVSEV